MTDEQLKKLTLGDLERIAARFSKAVRDIREGQALLGPPRMIVPASADVELPTEVGEIVAVEEDPAAAHRRRQFQPVGAHQPRDLRQTDPRASLSAAERAEKERLIRNRPPVDQNLPDDIKSMETAE